MAENLLESSIALGAAGLIASITFKENNMSETKTPPRMIFQLLNGHW